MGLLQIGLRVILIELLAHASHIPSKRLSLISIVLGLRRHPYQGLLQHMCTTLWASPPSRSRNSKVANQHGCSIPGDTVVRITQVELHETYLWHWWICSRIDPKPVLEGRGIFNKFTFAYQIPDTANSLR